MTKARTRRRRRRQGRTRWLTLENIGLIKQFFVTVGPIVVGAYLWVIPQIDAKAEQYVRSQFIAVGMDPKNIASLQETIVELQGQVKKKDEAVEELSDEVKEIKGDIGKVLYILEKQAPALATETAK